MYNPSLPTITFRSWMATFAVIAATVRALPAAERERRLPRQKEAHVES